LEPGKETSSPAQNSLSLLALLGTLAFFAWRLLKSSTLVQQTANSGKPQVKTNEQRKPSEIRKAIEPIYQQCERECKEHKCTEKDVEPPLLRVKAECDTPQAEQREDRTRYKRNLWVQILLTIGTWLAFCAAAYYAHVARSQRDTMNNTFGQVKEQTTILRQQLIGTQAAVIRLDQPNWGNSKLTASISNDGAVNAIHVNMMAEVLKENLPKRESCRKPRSN
jgi:hypothetical protein